MTSMYETDIEHATVFSTSSRAFQIVNTIVNSEYRSRLYTPRHMHMVFVNCLILFEQKLIYVCTPVIRG